MAKSKEVKPDFIVEQDRIKRAYNAIKLLPKDGQDRALLHLSRSLGSKAKRAGEAAEEAAAEAKEAVEDEQPF